MRIELEWHEDSWSGGVGRVNHCQVDRCHCTICQLAAKNSDPIVIDITGDSFIAEIWSNDSRIEEGA